MDEATKDYLDTLLNRVHQDWLTPGPSARVGHPPDRVLFAQLIDENVKLQSQLDRFSLMQSSFAHLENLLKEHEDLSVLRGNELCSMIANLPDPIMWSGAVRIPFFGVVTLTLRPMHLTTVTPATVQAVREAVMHPAPVQGGD